MKKLLWGEEEYLFWQPEQKSWVFSMKGTAERDSTMAAFRSNTSCLDISRFCLDPSQTCLQRSILIKLCFSAHLWFYLQGLCCKASSVNMVALTACLYQRKISCFTPLLCVLDHKFEHLTIQRKYRVHENPWLTRINDKSDLPGLDTLLQKSVWVITNRSNQTGLKQSQFNSAQIPSWKLEVEVKFNKLLNKPTFSFTLWLCVFLWLAGLLIDCILALYVHLLWKVTEL